MRHFLISTLQLKTAKLLGLTVLLLASAPITFAQTLPTVSINDLSVAERDVDLFGYEFKIGRAHV